MRLLTDLKKDLDEYGEYRNTAWWIVNINFVASFTISKFCFIEFTR